MTELIDIFDENWNPTGELMERSEAKRQGKWHRVAHIWIINPRGELLLQQRSPQKKSSHMWAISVAGHIGIGESFITGGIRELYEELGVNISSDGLIFISRNKSPKNFHLCTDFLIQLDLPVDAFTFNDHEVATVKYIHWRELAKLSADEMRAQNIMPHEGYTALFDYLEKKGL
ncbi:MAG: NUDIX domain-containing protein [Lactobacillales bacterium]|nr:NUDIX domain-containing protein [Lactobacillales bacterium]